MIQGIHAMEIQCLVCCNRLKVQAVSQRTAFLEKYRKSMNDEFKQPVNRNIYLQSPSEWVEIKL